MDIKTWDYTLGHYSDKEPLLTFSPSLNFINSSTNLNNSDLYVTISDTGSKNFDGKNFFAIVDKSSQNKIGCNIATSCVPDLSAQNILWTLSLPNTEYIEGLKGGKIKLVEKAIEDNIIQKEKETAAEAAENKKPVVKQSSDSPSGMSPLALGLVCTAGVCGILLTILLSRNKPKK